MNQSIQSRLKYFQHYRFFFAHSVFGLFTHTAIDRTEQTIILTLYLSLALSLSLVYSIFNVALYQVQCRLFVAKNFPKINTPN